MNREPDLIEQIKRHLDESVEDLDPLTTAKIAAASASALQEGTQKRLPWRWPAIGLATAVVAFLALMSTFRSAPPPLTAEQREVLAIIASEKNLEFFKDLEFYAWLEKNRDVIKGG
ncbi:MAG: hypothetical protein ACLQLE_06055 [Desulfobaccales bacterium]